MALVDGCGLRRHVVVVDLAWPSQVDFGLVAWGEGFGVVTGQMAGVVERIRRFLTGFVGLGCATRGLVVAQPD